MLLFPVVEHDEVSIVVFQVFGKLLVFDLVFELSDLFKVSLSLVIHVLVLSPHIRQFLRNLIFSSPQLLLHLPYLHLDLVVYSISHLLRHESKPPFLSLPLVKLLPLLVKLPMPS